MSQDTFVRNNYPTETINQQNFPVQYNTYPHPDNTTPVMGHSNQPMMVPSGVMKSPEGLLASRMNGFHLQSPATESNAMFPAFTYNASPPVAPCQRPVKVPVSPATNTVPKNLPQNIPYATPQMMNGGAIFTGNMLLQTPASVVPVAAGQHGPIQSSPSELQHLNKPGFGYYSTTSEKTASLGNSDAIFPDTFKSETSSAILNEITPEDMFATLTEPEDGDFPDTTNVTIDDILKDDPFVDLKPKASENDESFMSCFLDLDDLSGEDIPGKGNDLNGLGIYGFEKAAGKKTIKPSKRSGDSIVTESMASVTHSEKASKERKLKKSKSFNGNSTILSKSGSGSPKTPSMKQQPQFSFSECSGAFAIQSLYSFVLENLAMAGNKPSTSREPNRPLMKRAVSYALDSSPSKSANDGAPSHPLKSMESGCLQFQVNLGKNM